MPFFEDIGKKITNMGQSAIEKTKCSTETLRLNNQIREEQHLCKDLYQQIGQQYAQQYEANPDPAFKPLIKLTPHFSQQINVDLVIEKAVHL